MTVKEDADRVAAALKAASDSREAAKLPTRMGEIYPSIVVGDKAIVVSVPWSLIQEKPVADLSKYIMDKLK